MRSLQGGRALRLLVSLFVAVLFTPGVGIPSAHAKSEGVTFTETGKTLSGRFLDYWSAHGATQQFGLPISDEMQERSDLNGRTYTVQYFENVVVELHPENQFPYDVLLSLLGSSEYKRKYPSGAPGQVPCSSPDAVTYPETSKRVGCEFLQYWQQNGRLSQFGYPVSDEFTEQIGGKAYKVQYFERTVLRIEQNTSNRLEEWAYQRVTIPTLGIAHYAAKYPSQTLPAAVLSTPTAEPVAGCTPSGHGPSVSDELSDPPLRSSVGQGFVLTGTVRSSVGCAPVSGAKVGFELAGPDGQYDDDHTGSVLADGAGVYKFESNFPGFYGAGGPHIHVYVRAPGYRTLETEIFPACGQTQGQFDIVLAPD